MTVRVACPQCKEQGRDSGDNHLKLYEGKSDIGYCFHCKGTVRVAPAGAGYRGKKGNDVNLSVIQSYPSVGIPARKISKETCERFGIKQEVSELDGTPTAVYYPYHDHDGTVVGYKKRTLPKEFSVVGKIKGLFGQKQAKQNGRFLILVEGEHDVLAGWEILSKAGKSYNICSIPNGANETGALDGTLLKEMEWITKHEKVLLMLDNDAPGTRTATALAEALCSQTTVAIATLPRKDTAKCYEDGLDKAWFEAMSGCKVYHPEEIVEGKDLNIEVLRKPKKPGITMPYPKLQKQTHGLRKGEITLLSAASGIGKSTFAKELAYHLISGGSTVAMIALETQMEDVARAFIAMDNNVPAYKLIFHPDCIPEEDYERSVQWMFKENKLHFFKHWGSISPDALRTKMMYFAKALNVDFIVLDHVSMVIAGTDTSDERKDIDRLFEAMTQICVETGVGIIPVIHLKRVQGKKLNKGEEVELTDLRGCVDADTEFLSQDGWKSIADFECDDTVFTVDAALNGGFEAAEFVKLPCTEGMWRIKTNRLDMCLSDEHRIAHFTERDKENIRFTETKDAVSQDERSPTGFRGLIPCYLNGTLEKERFPGGEAALRVQVMMNADGWVRNHKTLRSSVRVKKERKILRARELLAAYTTDWYEFSGGPGYREFTFAPPRAKGFDSWYYKLCQEDLLVIADELKFWDGDISDGKFCSVSKQEADFVQFVYTSTGFRSPQSTRELESSFGGKYSAQDQYYVNKTTEKLVSFRNCPDSKREIERVQSPDGFKYCFKTATGLWLARRGGKIFVTGNSAGAEQMSFNVWALERNQQGEDGERDLVRIRNLKNRSLGFTGLADTLKYSHTTGRLELLDVQEFTN